MKTNLLIHVQKYARTWLAVLVMLCVSGTIQAQRKSVTGIVTDESGPLPGASVLVKGTSIATVTDVDGRFSLEASPSDVLEVSFIGYLKQSITVGGQTSISITLIEDVTKLDEIVVIGYGSAKKSDLTGAVAQVTAESFENQPLTRVGEALQGRAAGVTVARGGAPGAGFKIRIRGVNSITGNNDPLVVIDGVLGGDLRTLNPNDIASMEILKDASALAIYGSRGSNGVILVSTKKGSGKAKVNFDQFVSISDVPNQLSTISSAQFARNKNGDAIEAGNPAVYTDAQIADFEANPINYQDEIFQTGVSTNTQLSVSGGDDELRYFLSGSYTNQEGIVITTGYERFSMRSNLSAKLSDKIDVDLNLFANRETEINNPDAFNRFKGSSILKALTWDPTLPVRDENGEFILTSLQNANNGFNPIAALLRSKRERVADRLNAAFNFGYKFTDNFSYKLVVGLGILNQNLESFIRDGDITIENTNHTRINFNNTRSSSHQVSNILNWKQSIGDHNLDVSGVYEFQGIRNLNNGYSTVDVTAENFYLSDNDDQGRENFFNNGNESAIQSVLGRAQYNFKESLFLTASIRVDESSRFNKNNRTGYFPSGAIAYNFKNMDFVKNSKTLSQLKLRAGWGKVGNQNINSNGRFAISNNGGKYSFDGETQLTGSFDTQFPNQDLRWETTAQTNVGLDLGFLRNRITLSADYFIKDTEDLLIRTIVPGTSNISKFLNAGNVENKGIDLSIAGDIIEKDDLSWNAALTLSHVKNKVTELTGDLEQIIGNINSIDGSSTALNLIEKGQPLGQFYGLTYLGTWKTAEATEAAELGKVPGDAKHLRDEEGELVLGAIGNGLPTLTWGFNTTLEYKNWNLNVFVNAASGFQIYNQVQGAINGGTGDYRDDLSVNTSDAWTAENETDFPRRDAVNNLNSTRYVEDGSYVRLSNLRLGYTLKGIKGINSIQIYASGQNLLLITNYTGYDPEVTSNPVNTNNSNADVGPGINIGAYPNPRTYTFGVKVNL